MQTLKEAKGSETKFTQELATDTGIIDLNKVNRLLGLPSVIRATNEYSIPGGSIDVVGYTVKGDVIVYEHQDLTGRADQTHVAKTSHYARVMKSLGHKVLGTVLLCESIDSMFLEGFSDIRSEYERRKYKGHCNIHAVKSQWTDEGVYEPALFTDTEIIPTHDTVLDHYAEFVRIYGAEWSIQREERNGSAVTLWHNLSELTNKYQAYVHTTKNAIKIGIHCKQFEANDETFLQDVCPQGWTYRDSAVDKRTIELILPLDSTQVQWADATETLKRSIRKNIV